MTQEEREELKRERTLLQQDLLLSMATHIDPIDKEQDKKTAKMRDRIDEIDRILG